MSEKAPKFTINQTLTRRDLLRFTAATAVGMAAASCLPGRPVGEISPGQAPARLSSLNSSEPASQVLVVTHETPENPNYGGYLGEIVGSEGFSSDVVDDPSILRSETLSRYQTVILGENTTQASHIPALTQYLEKGGHLVANLVTDLQVQRFLGMELEGEQKGEQKEEGYVQVRSDPRFALDFPELPLQVHGRMTQAKFSPEFVPLAYGMVHRDETPAFPIAAVRNMGPGQVTVLNYQLAKTAAYSFLGNPDWVGQERDGAPGLRGTDRYQGKNTNGDDWADLEGMKYGSLDLHKRLLSNLIVSPLRQHPILQQELFPGDKDGVFIPTSDIHGRPPQYIDAFFNELAEGETGSLYYAGPKAFGNSPREALNGLALRFPGIYNMVSHNPVPTQDMVKAWQAKGHEFAPHPYAQEKEAPYDNPTLEEAKQGLHIALDELAKMGVQTVRTVRWHAAVALADSYAGLSKIQEELGVTMHLYQYPWGPLFKPLGANMDVVYPGSFYPMRAIDEKGNLLRTILQPTGMSDEQITQIIPNWQPYAAYLPLNQAKEVTSKLFKLSQANQFGPIVGEDHADNLLQEDGIGWYRHNLATARLHKYAISSTQKWLQFIQSREDTSYYDPNWDSETGEFSVTVVYDNPADPLGLRVPPQFGGRRLSSVSLNGEDVGLRSRTISGRPYQSISVSSGENRMVASYLI